MLCTCFYTFLLYLYEPINNCIHPASYHSVLLSALKKFSTHTDDNCHSIHRNKPSYIQMPITYDMRKVSAIVEIVCCSTTMQHLFFSTYINLLFWLPGGVMKVAYEGEGTINVTYTLYSRCGVLNNHVQGLGSLTNIISCSYLIK